MIVENEKKLSTIQSHIMDMIPVVIDICEKENIRYYMIGGTLLGAVRHKGFIPWDDDIDIGMERNDYEKFLKICEKHLPDHMKLRTYWDDSYHHFYWARIVDTRYHIKRMGSVTERQEELWIDILPLDGMPSGKAAFTLHKWKLQISRLVYHISCFDKVNVQRPGRPLMHRIIIKFLLVSHLWKFFASWDTKKCLDRIDKLLKKYSVEKTGCVMDYMGSTKGFPPVFRLDKFREPVGYPFEDMQLMGPADADFYLTSIYHDYMKLPPEHERNIHAEEFVEMADEGTAGCPYDTGKSYL